MNEVPKVKVFERSRVNHPLAFLTAPFGCSHGGEARSDESRARQTSQATWTCQEIRAVRRSPDISTPRISTCLGRTPGLGSEIRIGFRHIRPHAFRCLGGVPPVFASKSTALLIPVWRAIGYLSLGEADFPF